MSYHHTNRVRDHFRPILEEGFIGKFGGLETRTKLSHATQNILWQVASRLNEQTGSWRVSYKLLRDKTGASNDTIEQAFLRLQQEGCLIRVSEVRRSPSIAYEYKLGPALDCPADCEHLETHLTKAELLIWRSKNQNTNSGIEVAECSTIQGEERSISQSASAPIDRTLKERKENKKKVSTCSFCRVEPEIISGKVRNLHSDNCQELARIKNGQGWRIAISNNGEEAWIGLSSKDQQRAYYEDLARGEARKQNKLEAIDLEMQKREEELEELLGEDQILPGWLFWLRKRIETQPIKEQEIESAVKWSREGIDLVRGRGVWERGGYFTIEDLEPTSHER